MPRIMGGFVCTTCGSLPLANESPGYEHLWACPSCKARADVRENKTQFRARTPEEAATLPAGSIYTAWPVHAGFVCRCCGALARINPEDNREWACAPCNGATRSISLCFAPVGPQFAEFSFVMTPSNPDRDGDVIEPAGLELAPGATFHHGTLTEVQWLGGMAACKNWRVQRRRFVVEEPVLVCGLPVMLVGGPWKIARPFLSIEAERVGRTDRWFIVSDDDRAAESELAEIMAEVG